MFGGGTRGLMGLAADRLRSAVRNTAIKMSGGKIRRQDSSCKICPAIIGMIWTAIAYDEHSQQLAGMCPVPRNYLISRAYLTSTFGLRPATRK